MLTKSDQMRSKRPFDFRGVTAVSSIAVPDPANGIYSSSFKKTIYGKRKKHGIQQAHIDGPSYARTRENMEEFSQAGKAGKCCATPCGRCLNTPGMPGCPAA